jgi:glycosyltransferase involved in cell wall biosynthesis
MATYNRRASLARLLAQFAEQSLESERFEVIVVDDGSRDRVAEEVEAMRFPFALRVLTQANAGAAVARHRGILEAKGEVLVIVDDDMQVGPGFLAAHLAQHPAGSRRAVLGRIRADPAVGEMPFFERWYAHRLDSLAGAILRGTYRLTGSALYTGNVSLRRADYLAVGGFDPSLKRSEDAELGLRLEASGVELGFSDAACTLHGSDHTSEDVWLRRAFLYGVYDSRIGAKHPHLPQADPWRFLFRVRLPARPLLAAAVAAPRLTKPLSRLALAAVKAADRVGLSGVAFAGSAVVYSMEYFRGVRDEAGSLRAAVVGLSRHLRRGRSRW